MKSSELNKIMKKLSFPSNYIKKGRLAYSIIEHESGAKILKGFLLNSSINKDTFFLNYFVQPLYIPNANIDLSLGDRLGGYLNISDIERINEIINRFKDFEQLTSFSNYISFFESHPYLGSDDNRYICLAFINYLMSDYKKSRHFFKKIIDFENHQNPEWFEEKVKMAKEFVSFLDSNSYEKGLNKLLLLQKDTIKNLKLGK